LEDPDARQIKKYENSLLTKTAQRSNNNILSTCPDSENHKESTKAGSQKHKKNWKVQQYIYQKMGTGDW
jgi:hypothetical protein